MTNEQIKKILSNGKPSFYRLLPRPIGRIKTEVGNMAAELPDMYGVEVSQNDYLKELNPSSHAIFNKMRYPDKILELKVENEDGTESITYQREEIARIAIPFQQVIRTNTANHLTGNQLKFVLTTLKPTDKQKETFTTLQQRFIDKNMNIAFAEMVKAQLGTGDAAIYFFRENKKLDCEVFSFEKGDFLIPYYNSYNRLEKLYRYFKVKTEAGEDEEAFMEIDSKFVTEYRKRKDGRKREWVEISSKAHGFPRIPAVYKRGKVAHDDVQFTIEEFEWAISQFCESNAYFAFPILFLSGDVDSVPQKGSQGKIIASNNENAKANFITRQSGDMDAFKYQLEQLLNFIFYGSFTVNITPDILKSSGDMPGSAIRIVLHHEITKAMELAKEWDRTVDEIKELFTEGIGLEDGKVTEYADINFRLEIEVYVPENTTELISNLNLSVANGTLSKETAQRKNKYAAPDENRLFNEEKDREADREIRVKGSTNTPNNIVV